MTSKNFGDKKFQLSYCKSKIYPGATLNRGPGGTVPLNLVSAQNTKTQKKRLKMLENRSPKIIKRHAHIIKIQDKKKQHVFKFVRGCMNGTCCENFPN